MFYLCILLEYGNWFKYLWYRTLDQIGGEFKWKKTLKFCRLPWLFQAFIRWVQSTRLWNSVNYFSSDLFILTNFVYPYTWRLFIFFTRSCLFQVLNPKICNFCTFCTQTRTLHEYLVIVQFRSENYLEFPSKILLVIKPYRWNL